MPWWGEHVVIPYSQDWAQCLAQRRLSTLVGWISNKTRGFKKVNKGLGRRRERQFSVWTKRHEFTVFSWVSLEWYLVVPTKMFPHGQGQGCIMAAQGRNTLARRLPLTLWGLGPHCTLTFPCLLLPLHARSPHHSSPRPITHMHIPFQKQASEEDRTWMMTL